VSEGYDSRFALPDLDASGSAEAGVILLGLDADRLLAGLGLARLADDPALVTQVVDQARHGGAGFDLAGLVTAGLRAWDALRPRLAAPPGATTPGSLRTEWARAEVRVAAGDVHLDGAALGADYALATPEADAALVWAARTGGWVLDRVYTAKALAGLLAMAEDGRWRDGDDVVFWHTGGQPAVFAPGGLPHDLC